MYVCTVFIDVFILFNVFFFFLFIANFLWKYFDNILINLFKLEINK